MTDDRPRKELIWVGSSRKELREFPPPVRKTFGIALYAAQTGLTPPEAKPLKGFGGAKVLELAEDCDRGTYRAVYTVRFAEKIYVLHVFQKKSKRGIAKHEIELIRERLKTAQRMHEGRS
jgi:phage-related protein